MMGRGDRHGRMQRCHGSVQRRRERTKMGAAPGHSNLVGGRVARSSNPVSGSTLVNKMFTRRRHRPGHARLQLQVGWSFRAVPNLDKLLLRCHSAAAGAQPKHTL